jgi:hypothetical protein
LIDSHAAGKTSGFILSLRRYFVVSDVDPARSFSWSATAGLALLYTSAYFIPLSSPTGAYLLPSGHLFRLVILPTLVGVVSVGAVIFVASMMARRWLTPWAFTLGSVVALSLLTLVGLKGFVDAAGYDVESLVPRGQTLQGSVRTLKVGAAIALILLLWARRANLAKITRILSSVGFAFGLLAAVRLIYMLGAADAGLALASPAAAFSGQPPAAGADVADADRAQGGLPRRVVWVIFDETDFDRVYRSGALPPPLPNFQRMARDSVFATDANSPASATFYSIPALLSGTPIAGVGVKIDSRGGLALERTDRRMIPFDEGGSIFGSLAAEGRTASVLGFYHPYCKLFSLARCDSWPFPEVGELKSALVANIPNGLLEKAIHPAYWDTITSRSLRLLPGYIERDDALTFIHLNCPHLPSSYADRLLHLPASSDPLVEYSHNLRLADAILGQIIEGLERQAARHDLLLVVSSDHWLRKRWYSASETEVSRPVPLIMWKVGDSKGIELPAPLSTVHTQAMILDFLHGKIDTQSEIAQWWTQRPVDPAYIAPET